MIVSDKFVIGHIPKTGGHALAVMLSKVPGLKFQSPFNIENNIATSTEKSKHKPLTEVDTTGKDILCVLRKLPEWWLSYMVGQSLHYKLNEKNRLEKIQTRNTYHFETDIKVPKLLPPELMAYTIFPDSQLFKMKVSNLDITWLRQEYLANDLIEYLKIEDDFVATNIRTVQKSKHSYSKHIPDRYWNDTSIKTLYYNNPIWSLIEQKVYGV